ncbi:hypothetical protein [Nocardia ignorata]|uniref:hypothetical protein n=1 Tax=Nocardia ignorata TaxID=145285 RepID=UPI00082E6CDE|nr:hypothetical protein [Nocardia ignorata]
MVEPGCRAEPFPPPHTEVAPCSASAVLKAAVTTLYRLDPVAEVDARSTFETARPLMWAAYSTDARIGVSLWAPITPEVWQDWVEHRVPLRTDAYPTDDGHSPDTATASSRVFSVSLTPVGRAPIVFSVSARSTRAGAERAWLVAEMRVL